jgi:hypothetical protein
VTGRSTSIDPLLGIWKLDWEAYLEEKREYLIFQSRDKHGSNSVEEGRKGWCRLGIRVE